MGEEKVIVGVFPDLYRGIGWPHPALAPLPVEQQIENIDLWFEHRKDIVTKHPEIADYYRKIRNALAKKLKVDKAKKK